MSILADFCITKLVKIHSEQLNFTYNPPLDENNNPLQLIIMGMGKVGGMELNVSSDIDLVFLFDYEGQTSVANNKPSIYYSQYFEKLGQKIIQGLNKITEYGFVFRVDMRLRPYGDIGSIVCSLPMFEEYLLNQGRAWERFAWLKARQIYPNNKHYALEKIIQTFVYRKYLDYTLLDSLLNVYNKINAPQIKYKHNIKLGVGGIREIEFISQVYQLIYGGQKPFLQTKKTIEALSIFAEHNILSASVAQNLSLIYIQYRNIEHAIQYINDEHSHNLPNDLNSTEWHNLLVFLPYFNGVEHLQQWLEQSKIFVHSVFEKIFNQQSISNNVVNGIDKNNILFDLDNIDANSYLHNWLEQHNFPIPLQITTHIHKILNSAKYKNLSENTQNNFKKTIELGLLSCKNLDNKDIVFLRYLDFIYVINQRTCYLDLLVKHPQIINSLVKVLAHSMWLAQYIIKHPQVIDELLRWPNTFKFDWDKYKQNLTAKLEYYSNDVEQQLEILRHNYHSQIFSIILHEINEQADVLQTADLISSLVDSTLEVIIQVIWNTLNCADEIPHFAVVGYGKLGGKELGYESDLDLIFLYDAYNSNLDDASTTYSYVARKIITWLTSNTIAGKVCDIDTRLRPNGQSGLLVSSIQAFEDYQIQRAVNGAMTWEHQALSRARFCAGNSRIGEKFEEIRRKILKQSRSQQELKDSIINMRNKISQDKKYENNIFHIKYSVGGMIDVEFCVQYIVLFYSKDYPQLLENLGNIKLLNLAKEFNLLPQNIVQNVIITYAKYRKLQYTLRLDNKKLLLDKNLFADDIYKINQLWEHVFLTDNI